MSVMQMLIRQVISSVQSLQSNVTQILSLQNEQTTFHTHGSSGLAAALLQ